MVEVKKVYIPMGGILPYALQRMGELCRVHLIIAVNVYEVGPVSLTYRTVAGIGQTYS